MRVIGGEWRSRRLQAPAGRGMRPSSDRLRETLFDILGGAVRGARFVDAYAGTGAVGIEAWSRGARPVIWIERERAVARVLRANLAELGLERAEVWERDAGTVWTKLEAGGECDFFFFDPPYAAAAEYERMLSGLERRPGLVTEATRIIAECGRGAGLPERRGRLRRERVHAVGDSELVFYRAEPT